MHTERAGIRHISTMIFGGIFKAGRIPSLFSFFETQKIDHACVPRGNALGVKRHKT
ncbi:protein of unknown function (plasmid) [Caballeronia sp. S22]